MRDTELFEAALGLSSPWVVLRSEFDPDQKQLDLLIGFARGSRFACPPCGAEGCGVHDVREREWRHLNFFQHKTVLKASIPRVTCDKCGIKQVSPPWGADGVWLHAAVRGFPACQAQGQRLPPIISFR